MTSEGMKFDTEKVRFELIDPEAEEALAKVLTMGAKKYADNNWKRVDNAIPRYVGALRRHLNAIERGELIDPESKLQHAAHVMCNAMFLHYFLGQLLDEFIDLQRHDDRDDRAYPKSKLNSPVVLRDDDAEERDRLNQLSGTADQVLDFCRAHLSAGARVFYDEDQECLSLVSSPDNPASNGRIHISLSALRRLSRDADGGTS